MTDFQSIFNRDVMIKFQLTDGQYYTGEVIQETKTHVQIKTIRGEDLWINKTTEIKRSITLPDMDIQRVRKQRDE